MPIADLRPQAALRSPDEMVAHLNAIELDLQFTAGIWFFSPSDSRFHGRYKANIPLEARLEVAHSLQALGDALLARLPDVDIHFAVIDEQ